ncbi:glycosyl transferase [Gramella sp. GC03-9]|uniref:Glycosyl transferase n=1 Tax=Christiangramia oceanisediminis TaxID=2920386 RepID=A0A9X2RAB6_9FLAO|nr:glycosyltransferase family protein [Gramella oceanisediminis]MCP9201278.1 glycosyl transferase [Gramella oceanisediminis]
MASFKNLKILYAIQGTGNGHLCRAIDIIPILKNYAEVDILISGIQADIELPYEVTYRLKGLSFIFGKKGGVNIWQTYRKNHLKSVYNEIKDLPVEQYDLVINDFEPISAWAAFLKNKPCFALSHQSAVLDKSVPLPEKNDWMGKWILKNYAPATVKFGFHFEEFNQHIFTPVIRKQIRDLETTNKGHYTVYLPAYSDERIIKILNTFPQVQWEVFSKHNSQQYSIGNIHIHPVNNETFLKSFASCTGIICGAGFETPAEALFLRKKLLVIPMKNQFEQHCNAAALKKIGVPVIQNFKSKNIEVIHNWLNNHEILEMNYPDRTAEIIENLLTDFQRNYSRETQMQEKLLKTV